MREKSLGQNSASSFIQRSMIGTKPPIVQRGNQTLEFGVPSPAQSCSPAWPLPAQSSRAVPLAAHRAPAGRALLAGSCRLGSEGQGRPVEVELKETGHRATARGRKARGSCMEVKVEGVVGRTKSYLVLESAGRCDALHRKVYSLIFVRYNL